MLWSIWLWFFFWFSVLFFRTQITVDNTVAFIFHNFLVLWQSASIYLFVFFYFYSIICWKAKSTRLQVLFFVLINTRSSAFDWIFCIPKMLREFYTSHFLEQFLLCVYTICQHYQTLVFCRIPNELLFLPSHT